CSGTNQERPSIRHRFALPQVSFSTRSRTVSQRPAFAASARFAAWSTRASFSTSGLRTPCHSLVMPGPLGRWWRQYGGARPTRCPHPSPPERPPLPDLARTALVGQVNQRLKGWEAVRWVDGAPQVTDELRAEVDRFGGRCTGCCARIRGRRCAGAAESRPSAAPRRTPPCRST